jgi:gliding motility-associated-like protein
MPSIPLSTRSLVVIIVSILFLPGYVLKAQIAGFTSPDTVYTNQPVTISNTSTGGTTWCWNFCSGNSLLNPEGTNIGNPGSMLDVPGYSTLVKDGATCYSFVTTHGSNRVVRYNHGTSFSNNPVSWTSLGNPGLISDTVQGIRIRYDNGQWIGIINDNTRIVRMNFGTSLSNTPAISILGPYPMMYTSHGLEIFNEGGNWVGFIACSLGNKFVRVNFGSSLLNTPVLTDLGTPGSMNMPSTFSMIKENGLWYALVVNIAGNTLTRLSFGNSLLNTPTGVNLGTPCSSITAGGIALIRDCGSTAGFQLNSSTSSPDLIWRLGFPSGITGPVTGTSLGNIGNMIQPLRFSELFRVEDTLFLYASNRLNGTLTRLRFLPCTNASVPSSALFNPPAYSYSQPGTYNILLIMNEGMPNQISVCKSIVVIPPPSNITAAFQAPDTVCTGAPVTLVNQTVGGSTFYWNFCSGNLNDNPAGQNTGNPGGYLSVPTYSTLITDGNEHFSFISNQGSQSVIRYDHGSSFANPPSNQVNLGSFGLLGSNVEGIQVKKEGSGWIGFVCNYDQLVRLNFGPSLKNIPSATLITTGSMLEMAHGFLLENVNGEWVGLITCSIGNRLVRVHFGNSLMNSPTFENLGTAGVLDTPGQMAHIIEGGNNYVFVVNLLNSTLSRLNFGSSLNNTPTGTNLGAVCGSLAMGITLMRDCGSVHGFITRYQNNSVSNDLLWKISFPGGITGPVETQNLGNIGQLERPSLFSELFRQNDTLFVYSSNRGNGTRTLLSFASCNNATPPSSALFNPPPYSYDTPGTYNVRLLVNEGMPDQESVCKTITVQDKPSHGFTDTTLCSGVKWYAGGAWQTQPGIYYDTIHFSDNCDSIIQTTLRYKPAIPVSLGNDTLFCNGIPITLRTGVPNAGYKWQDGSIDSTYTAYGTGDYWVTVKKEGCSATDSIHIGECVSPLWFPNVFTPNGDGLNETFHPVGYGVVKFNILIYDRWGKKIFESNSVEPGWDGRINGELCSDGVYMFIATYNLGESSGETWHANGSVTVLR